jgi:hypothetical protein
MAEGYARDATIEALVSAAPFILAGQERGPGELGLVLGKSI